MPFGCLNQGSGISTTILRRGDRRHCVSIWQSRSGPRIGSAWTAEATLRKGQPHDSGAGGISPVPALDPHLLPLSGASRSPHSPHGLQEMGRRPSKVPPLQGRGATDFRRRGRAPPLHRERQISRPPSSSTCVPAPKGGEGASPPTAFAAHEGRAGCRADETGPEARTDDDPHPRRRV